jgi:hypothetical protein
VPLAKRLDPAGKPAWRHVYPALGGAADWHDSDVEAECAKLLAAILGYLLRPPRR